MAIILSSLFIKMQEDSNQQSNIFTTKKKDHEGVSHEI
jgi:hypothetical protein